MLLGWISVKISKETLSRRTWYFKMAAYSTHALGSLFGHSLHAALEANHIEVFYHVTTFKIFSLIHLISLWSQTKKMAAFGFQLSFEFPRSIRCSSVYVKVQCFVRKVDFEEVYLAVCRSSSMEGRLFVWSVSSNV